MGLAVVILFALPWLDYSPVKSIRYRGILYKSALALFVITFVALGLLGVGADTRQTSIGAVFDGDVFCLLFSDAVVYR